MKGTIEDELERIARDAKEEDISKDKAESKKEYLRKKTDSLYEMTKQGKKALEEVNIDATIAEFKETVKIDSEYGKHHFLLGDALFLKWLNKRLDRKEKRPEELRPEITKSAHRPAAGYLAAPYKDEKNEINYAVWEYEQAIKLDPNDFLSHCRLAMIWLKGYEYQEAIPRLESAINLESDHPDLHYYLGVAKEVGGFWQAGELGMDPSVRRKNYEKMGFDGENDIREAIRLNKEGDARYHFELSLILDEKGRKEEALDELKGAVRLDYNNATYHFELGKKLLRTNRTDEAENEFKIVQNLDPNYKGLKSELNWVRIEKRR